MAPAADASSFSGSLPPCPLNQDYVEDHEAVPSTFELNRRLPNLKNDTLDGTVSILQNEWAAREVEDAKQQTTLHLANVPMHHGIHHQISGNLQELRKHLVVNYRELRQELQLYGFSQDSSGTALHSAQMLWHALEKLYALAEYYQEELGLKDQELEQLDHELQEMQYLRFAHGEICSDLEALPPTLKELEDSFEDRVRDVEDSCEQRVRDLEECLRQKDRELERVHDLEEFVRHKDCELEVLEREKASRDLEMYRENWSATLTVNDLILQESRRQCEVLQFQAAAYQAQLDSADDEHAVMRATVTRLQDEVRRLKTTMEQLRYESNAEVTTIDAACSPVGRREMQAPMVDAVTSPVGRSELTLAHDESEKPPLSKEEGCAELQERQNVLAQKEQVLQGRIEDAEALAVRSRLERQAVQLRASLAASEARVSHEEIRSSTLQVQLREAQKRSFQKLDNSGELRMEVQMLTAKLAVQAEQVLVLEGMEERGQMETPSPKVIQSLRLELACKDQELQERNKSLEFASNAAAAASVELSEAKRTNEHYNKLIVDKDAQVSELEERAGLHDSMYWENMKLKSEVEELLTERDKMKQQQSLLHGQKEIFESEANSHKESGDERFMEITEQNSQLLTELKAKDTNMLALQNDARQAAMQNRSLSEECAKLKEDLDKRSHGHGCFGTKK
eukprot:gnl/MRDRNA2_/MRDRNA2_104785_c0_seq1.p1 gnl/MRDRNA2_/MRDRNA2_104785_c0~~gnl/MRDRNA2_/MRDRNA2_104785_c0_seq1.p1  ORF type:complete len:682 (+),score=182.82 gnl/MRDRNA2_/MRDRNA2_104785_c0_seq1:70-2115(+)